MGWSDVNGLWSCALPLSWPFFSIYWSLLGRLFQFKVTQIPLGFNFAHNKKDIHESNDELQKGTALFNTATRSIFVYDTTPLQ